MSALPDLLPPRRSFWKASLAVTLSGVAICFGPAAHGEGEPPSGSVATALAEEVRSVFERVKGSVVKIEACDENGQLVGNGFFIDPHGTLLTSYSVGGESFNIVVSYGEKRCPAKRLTADSRSGVAILKLEKETSALPFLRLGRSKELGVASPVIMVAHPMDLPLAPNFGMIAGFERKYLDRYFATTHIRANVPVKRGEGGAPLLNMRGEAVGMVVSSLEGGGACFALPVEAAAKVHRDYVRFGAPRPGWLGLMIEPVDPAPNGSTVAIERLEEGGPALKAGLQPGDVLQKIGEFEIRAPEDLLNAAFFLTEGEAVEVTVLRSGETLTVPVSPGPRLAGTEPQRRDQQPVTTQLGTLTGLEYIDLRTGR